MHLENTELSYKNVYQIMCSFTIELRHCYLFMFDLRTQSDKIHLNWSFFLFDYGMIPNYISVS